jgi:hypothetical protein
MKIDFSLYLFLLAALMVGGCSDDSAPQFVPVQAGPSWTIAYSPSMPPKLAEQSGNYAFDFPTSTDGIDYVIKKAPAVQPGQTITMVFSLEGDGKLLATEGTASARVRLFMQRAGDTMTAGEPYKRWWSKAYVELVSPGTFTLSTKIEPSEWTSVFGVAGSSARTDFADCVTNLANLGFTFGGVFAGHGVYVTDGAVRFVLKQYSVH